MGNDLCGYENNCNTKMLNFFLWLSNWGECNLSFCCVFLLLLTEKPEKGVKDVIFILAFPFISEAAVFDPQSKLSYYLSEWLNFVHSLINFFYMF
jgi:hypothetical protein